MTDRPGTAPQNRSHLPPALRLFGASFLALFLELSLIRFFPAHIRAVGYFTNLVLIASFLGLGLGFLLETRKVRLERFLLPLVLLCIGLARLLSEVRVTHAAESDEPLWLFSFHGQASSFEVPVLVPVLASFIAAAAVLVPVGQVMGRLFRGLPTLTAYALDLAGSFTGVLCFGLLSALGTPPALWFAIALAVVVAVMCRGVCERTAAAGLSAATVVLLLWMESGCLWSPYYMVQVEEQKPDHITVLTNGVLHQVMLDFDSPDPYNRLTRERFELPYRQAPRLDDVLIVGAGTGNDVAIAQAMGAGRIDAVEIDPLFPELGRARHPAHPYADDNVTVVIDDARSFFKRTDRRYDLVVFGTLDSQALLSGFSSVRLDNYVYTQEAFSEAWSLLKPDGLLAVFHMSIRPYIANRIFLLLAQAAGRPPIFLRFQDHTLFNALFLQARSLPVQPLPPDFLASLRSETIPSDDWPYLYLAEPSVPAHYVTALAAMVLLALLATGLAVGRGAARRFDPAMFLLGAGFLLLETRSVTQMSLLFGSTWTVNLLVFSSILAVLFLANLLVQRLGGNASPASPRGLAPRLVFPVLLLVLVGLYFLQAGWLAGLPDAVQWLAAGLCVALPIGLAGLIFPALLRASPDPVAAFGSNLLGAIVGGVAEYLAMMVGIASLSLLAALFYLAAYVLWPRTERPPSPAGTCSPGPG